MGKRIYIFLCSIYLCSCLKPGSLDEAAKSENTAPESVELPQTTRAPLEIDPSILANRSFQEAPFFAERVSRGALPPISERLPENPLVVVPLEEIGVYGGTLRRALTDDTVQETAITKTLNENLMGYERPVAKSIQFNIAESYRFSDDGKTAIFKIRKGIRWSDGVPVSVDDILFWYYDMIFDENANTEPMPPNEWLVDGIPMKLEKIDDLTLRITSPKPLGRVLNNLCHDDLFQPKHIWAPYHPRYNPEATFADFKNRTTVGRLVMKPGIPRLSAWVPVEWVRGQKIVYERNPYYFKVDSAGNQLPYADRLEFIVIPERQMILLKFLNGELDLVGRNFSIDMVSAARADEKLGRIRLLKAGPTQGPTLYLNWDAPNPALRTAFRDKKVRIALSHGINRDEINRISYSDLLVPGGYTFLPANPYFSAEAAQKYASYDPDLSRSLLNAAGFPDSDGDGIREFKDGTPFQLIIDVNNTTGFLDVAELIAEHWKQIGVRVHLNPGKEEILFPRRMNGEHDIYIWNQKGAADPLDTPHLWAIWSSTTPFWHRNATVEGPPWLWDSTALMRRALFTIDPEVRREALSKVRDLHTEETPNIGIGFKYKIWGASTRLGNIPVKFSPENNFRGWSRPVFHEQIFIKPNR